MGNFHIKTPNNIEELVSCLKEVEDKTYLLSGGTDLVIKLRKNKIYTGTMIDLSGVKEMKYIKVENDIIQIGANITFSEIIENKYISQHCTCLKEAAQRVGSTQIRNMATIGGNISNAAPCADSITALMALGAKIKGINSNGEVWVRELDEVVLGAEKNKLAPDEVITEINVPLLGGGYKSSFGKIGSRTAVTIAKLNMAVVIKYNEIDGVIEDVTVALGALAPKAFISNTVGKVLLSEKPSNELLVNFKNALIQEVDIAIKGRASHPYKRIAITGLAEDVYNCLFKVMEIGGGN